MPTRRAKPPARPSKGAIAPRGASLPAAPAALVGDACRLIEAARERAATAVNAELTLLYWRVGARIRNEVLGAARAAYGEQIVPALAATLTRAYGRGFAEKSLRRMVQFAENFPDESNRASRASSHRYRAGAGAAARPGERTFAARQRFASSRMPAGPTLSW